MNRLLSTIVFGVLAAMPPGAAAAAQSKTVPGEMKLVTGTVETIDVATRTLGIKTGTEYEEIEVPNGVPGFSAVKVGDRLTLRYYDNIVLIVKKPGDRDVYSGSSAITPGVPGRSGTVSEQRTITATITAIDPKVPSITFTGPRDWTYSTRVEDKAALAKVKVGDKVDITWTDAVMVTVEDPK